jgi:hypothetical protein
MASSASTHARDVLFSPLPKEYVAELIVVSAGMVVPEINIHPARRGRLRRMVRNFLDWLAGTHLECQLICIVFGRRVHILSSLSMV